MTLKAKAKTSAGPARIAWRLASNAESIAEGVWWFVLLTVCAVAALIVWPAKEIFDTWTTGD